MRKTIIASLILLATALSASGQGSFSPAARLLKNRQQQARPEVKAAIEREKSQAGLNSSEREQARPEVKGKAGDILVKALLNEREATLPIKTDQYPYYDWKTLRQYYLDKLAEFDKINN